MSVPNEDIHIFGVILTVAGDTAHQKKGKTIIIGAAMLEATVIKARVPATTGAMWMVAQPGATAALKVKAKT